MITIQALVINSSSDSQRHFGSQIPQVNRGKRFKMGNIQDSLDLVCLAVAHGEQEGQSCKCPLLQISCYVSPSWNISASCCCSIHARDQPVLSIPHASALLGVRTWRTLASHVSHILLYIWPCPHTCLLTQPLHIHYSVSVLYDPLLPL